MNSFYHSKLHIALIIYCYKMQWKISGTDFIPENTSSNLVFMNR